MNYITLSVSVAAGIAVGSLFSLKNEKASGEPIAEKQPEQVKKRRVDRSQNIAARVKGALVKLSKVPDDFVNGSKTAQEWAEMILDKKNVFLAAELNTTAGLIPQGMMGDVVRAIELAEEEKPERTRRLSVELIREWYRRAPDEVLEWGELGRAEDSGNYRYLMAMSAVAYEAPEVGMQMFSYLDHVKLASNYSEFSHTRTQLKRIVRELGRHMRHTRTTREFWEFYDGLPKEFSKSLGYSLGDVSAGKHAEYFSEQSKRFPRATSVSLVSSWVEKDPVGLVGWLGDNYKTLNRDAKRTFLNRITKSDDEQVIGFIRSIAGEESDLPRYILMGLEPEIEHGDMKTVRKRLQDTVPGVGITASDINGVLHIADRIDGRLALVDLIKDPYERYKGTAYLVSSLQRQKDFLRMGENIKGLSATDIQLVKERINGGGYTEAQRAKLLQLLGKVNP